MKKSLPIGVVVTAITLSYIAYHTWVLTPEKLLRMYEECKIDASISYDMNWLRQCNNQKALSKECKKILSDGFPWDTRRALNDTPWNLTEEDINNYNTLIKNISDCQCETLPKMFADIVNDQLKEAEEKCLSELEVATKVMQ